MAISIPPPRLLTDSRILIAGGTSGVGLASALRFAEQGAPGIVLIARDPVRGAEAVKRISLLAPSTKAWFVAGDANDPQDLERAAVEARAHLGRIDVLVNSTASNYVPNLLHNIPLDQIAAMFTKQALPPIYLSRIVLPWMREQRGGSIINLASDAAKVATPGETVLGGAMAAIVMFSRTLAIEAKRDGIRVNAVTPSLIAGTPTAALVLKDGFSKKLFESATALAHLGVAEPEDLAALIVFLGSPESARLTGQAISVNGGISAA